MTFETVTERPEPRDPNFERALDRILMPLVRAALERALRDAADHGHPKRASEACAWLTSLDGEMYMNFLGLNSDLVCAWLERGAPYPLYSNQPTNGTR